MSLYQPSPPTEGDSISAGAPWLNLNQKFDRTVDSFRMSKDAHDAYYAPLEERVAELAGCADIEVRRVLEGIRKEIEVVRRFPGEAGYTFFVLRRADGRAGAAGGIGSTVGSDTGR